VYVSIGSNVERERHIGAALAELRTGYGAVAVSPVYECRAEGFAGADFYNLVVSFECSDPPQALVARLRAIEAGQGRVRGGARLADRTLDLDLLLYDDRVLDEAGLHLPRPEILERAFVLRPLADLAPEGRHPLSGASYAALWAGMRDHAPPLNAVAFAP
jgi:2-amino-4-hydroxy-6-hydroxymethyldihydropteridine diphosphokinase